MVDVYVNYLRNKIQKGFDKKLIHTVIGMGYILREQQ
jgi:DNA-binding response OmpR family regulator